MSPPPAASPVSLDLAAPRRVHVIGVGGAGMSGIATILAQQGHRVTGSDLAEGPALAALRDLGVEVVVGHDPARVRDADAVVISSAVPPDDVEVAEARRLEVPVLTRRGLLPSFAAVQPFVSISGTHGKTTTSSMVAAVLRGTGHDPSFLVGAPVPVLGAASSHGSGAWFVLEADESDSSFLAGPRAAAIVTNVEPDHLEHWGGWDELRAGFEQFLAETDGPRLVCVDDPEAAAIGRRVGAVGYGTSETAEHRIVDLQLGPHGSTFTLQSPSARTAVRVAVPGEHNARNAAGALALVSELGVAPQAAAEALGAYTGVARRFEARGDAAGVHVVDDYAHLPTEVRAALAAGRSGGWDRVVAVFQPHRYSRTQALAADFAEAFDDADVVVLTEIYAAGEAPRPGVSGRLLVEAVQRSGSTRVEWAPTLDDAVDLLVDELRPGDLCMSIGAGDVTTLADRLLPRLAAARLPAAQLRELDDALGFLGDALRAEHPLGPLSTYRVGGAAQRYVLVADADQLVRIAEALAGLTWRPPTLVVGKGSNLLVADRGVAGLVLQLGEAFAEVMIGEPAGDDGATVVRAGAAASLPVVARQTVAAGLTGFEWAVGVPGSIGGAVRMNAGGHGAEMAAVVRGVRVVDLATGEDGYVEEAMLEFGYRRSALGPAQVVVSADLELRPGDAESGRAELAEIVRWRRDNQPGGQNAGSVFTNPPGDSAGRLIDAAGCKGLRIGSAEVSPKHANFIQVDPDGSADDVAALMAQVIERVRSHAGVTLHPETVMVGFEVAP